MTWEMRFLPGVARLVIVDRSTAAGLRSVLSPIRVNYVLRAGAGWVGPVGRAVVSLDPGPGRILEATPGYVGYGDTVTWTFSDLEPDFDISASVRNPVWTDHAVGQRPQPAGPDPSRRPGPPSRWASNGQTETGSRLPIMEWTPTGYEPRSSGCAGPSPRNGATLYRCSPGPAWPGILIAADPNCSRG